MTSSLHTIESTIQQPDMVDPRVQSEVAETEDDHEASDTDQEHDIRANDQTSTDASGCMRSIYIKCLSDSFIKLWFII